MGAGYTTKADATDSFGVLYALFDAVHARHLLGTGTELSRQLGTG